jgi:hypothetical protein
MYGKHDRPPGRIPGFLLTTTHHVLAFDGQEGFFKVHSGKGLYYGIARDGQHIYISCRNRTDGPADATARAEERGSILILDAATLLPIFEIRPEDFPLRDVHGIAYFDSKLWVNSSFDNLVAVFDTTTRRWTKWYPSIYLSARDRDVNHFNTIVSNGESICILAHNNGPSHLLSYDRSSLDLTAVLELGNQAHDIFPAGGGIGTCSSADGMLAASTGWRLRTGAFPRGVACRDDTILIGLSQMAHRSVRHEMSGIVRRFTPQWRHTADYVLPSVGMVLAMLPVDLAANAVAALEPFEADFFRGAYNPLEPGNVYHAGENDTAAFAPEWHLGEITHRWTAARKSRMTIVVNPGESALAISASSGFPGPYWTEVTLNGHALGALRWTQPGCARSEFTLPAGVQGSCEIAFRVPHLWQPSTYLYTDDQRKLGVLIQELKLL